jgi:RNA polymerase sigma-70 factor (ECF subfamily)
MNKRARKQPPEELVSFCSAQQVRLRGLLTVYCGDADLAGELAQEALARLCMSWNRVRRMANPQAWLTRVALNLANSHYRRRRAERRATERSARRAERVHVDPDGADAVAIRSAVARLPQRPRSALVLRYYAGFSVAEVADLMGCPEGTVKTLTRKAIASLREEINIEDEGEVSNVV